MAGLIPKPWILQVLLDPSRRETGRRTRRTSRIRPLIGQCLFPDFPASVLELLKANSYGSKALLSEINDKDHSAVMVLTEEAINDYLDKNGTSLKIARHFRGSVIKLVDYNVRAYLAEDLGDCFFFFEVTRIETLTLSDSKQFTDLLDNKGDNRIRARLKRLWLEKYRQKGANSCSLSGEATQLLMDLTQSQQDDTLLTNVNPKPLAFSFVICPADEAALANGSDLQPDGLGRDLESHNTEGEPSSMDSFAASFVDENWEAKIQAAQQQAALVSSSRQSQISNLLSAAQDSQKQRSAQPEVTENSSPPRRTVQANEVPDPCLLAQATVDLDLSSTGSSGASQSVSEKEITSARIDEKCLTSDLDNHSTDCLTVDDSSCNSHEVPEPHSLEAPNFILQSSDPSPQPLIRRHRSFSAAKVSDTSLQALEAIAREDVCLDESLVRRGVFSNSPLTRSAKVRHDNLNDSEVHRNLFSSGSVISSGTSSSLLKKPAASPLSPSQSPVLFSSGPAGEEKQHPQDGDNLFSKKVNNNHSGEDSDQSDQDDNPFELNFLQQDSEPVSDDSLNPFSLQYASQLAPGVHESPRKFRRPAAPASTASAEQSQHTVPVLKGSAAPVNAKLCSIANKQEQHQTPDMDNHVQEISQQVDSAKVMRSPHDTLQVILCPMTVRQVMTVGQRQGKCNSPSNSSGFHNCHDVTRSGFGVCQNAARRISSRSSGNQNTTQAMSKSCAERPAITMAAAPRSVDQLELMSSGSADNHEASGTVLSRLHDCQDVVKETPVLLSISTDTQVVRRTLSESTNHQKKNTKSVEYQNIPERTATRSNFNRKVARTTPSSSGVASLTNSVAARLTGCEKNAVECSTTCSLEISTASHRRVQSRDLSSLNVLQSCRKRRASPLFSCRSPKRRHASSSLSTQRQGRHPIERVVLVRDLLSPFAARHKEMRRLYQQCRAKYPDVFSVAR